MSRQEANEFSEKPVIKVKPGEPIRISPTLTFQDQDALGRSIETYGIEVEGIGKGRIFLREDHEFKTHATIFSIKALAGPVTAGYTLNNGSLTEQSLPITVNVEVDDVDHSKELE